MNRILLQIYRLYKSHLKLSGRQRLAVYSILLSLLSACAVYNGSNTDRYDYLRSQLVAIALEMQGTPYRYGGTSPSSGFDCSGLVHYSFLQHGVNVPRTSLSQFKASRPIRINQLKPGDLVFFRTKNIRVSHVGIYIGDNKFVHAPGSGKTVQVTSLDNRYYKKRFAGAGTFL